MEVQVDIAFDQLVKLVKSLPDNKLKKLKAAIEQKDQQNTAGQLENLLLSGPTATEKQLGLIEKNRKAVNQWRKKEF